MRYVVRGAAGFIGSARCDHLLKDGHDVVGVDSFTDYYARRIKEDNIRDALAHPSFELAELDLASAELEPLMRGSAAGGHRDAALLLK